MDLQVVRPFGFILNGRAHAWENGPQPQSIPDDVAEIALRKRWAFRPGLAGRPSWFPEWSSCVIVASGPSAATAPLDVISDPVITINNSWELYPNAAMLYASDARWWSENGGATAFNGLKVSQDQRAVDTYGINRVWLDNKHEILLEQAGRIGHGGNSGFQALNLAVQFGCRDIALVGFDMRVDAGVHWHGPHPRGMNNPSDEAVRRWARAFAANAPLLERLGVRVVNCSRQSALTCFPKRSLLEWTARDAIA